MKIKWLKPDQFISFVAQKFKNVNVVLDIGCGIMPQNYVRPIVHICCEPFDQYVEHLKEKTKNNYDREYVIIRASWKEAVKIFPEKSIDTIFLVDVIEHLEKKEAKILLRKTEKIARKQIIIFTPLGFIPQSHPSGKDAWGLNGGAWQEHKSGWLPEDFGNNWDIFACKDYHKIDNMGKKYKKPKGAFWAIKNISIYQALSRYEYKRNLYNKFIVVSHNISNILLIRINIFIFKIIAKISNIFNHKKI